MNTFNSRNYQDVGKELKKGSMVIKVDKLHLFEFISGLYSKHFVCLQVNVKWWCVDVVFGVFLMCSS
jgi:hypothetical protein